MRTKYDVKRDGIEIARKLAGASTPETNYGSDEITPGDVETAMTKGTGPVWFAWSGPKDDAVFTAITGNGPTSEANAVFFAHARDMVLALADEVEMLRELAALRAAPEPCPAPGDASKGDE